VQAEVGRRLGLAAQARDKPDPLVIVLEGRRALEVLGATETLGAWNA
jgi:hypothetical protein